MVVVLPGDRVAHAGPSAEEVKLGPGVLQSAEPQPEGADIALTAIKGGALGHVLSEPRGRGKKAERGALPSTVHGWWVESSGTRYVPAPNDQVIGQVTKGGVESYSVSLFSAHNGTLPALAFEGATRRNRPNLAVGDLVYARVAAVESWMEPELSCVDATTGRAEGLGELKADAEHGYAMLWPVSLALARSMHRPKHQLLPRIAAHFPFEAAVGLNGLVWTRTGTAQQGVALGQLLAAADRAAAQRDEGEMALDEADAEADARSLNSRLDHRGELAQETIARIVRQFT